MEYCTHESLDISRVVKMLRAPRDAMSQEVNGFLDRHVAIGEGFSKRWTQKGMRRRFGYRGTRKHNLYGGQIFIAATYIQTPYRGSGRRATATDPSTVDLRNYPKSTESRLEPATCSCVCYTCAFPRALFNILRNNN